MKMHRGKHKTVDKLHDQSWIAVAFFRIEDSTPFESRNSHSSQLLLSKTFTFEKCVTAREHECQLNLKRCWDFKYWVWNMEWYHHSHFNWCSQPEMLFHSRSIPMLSRLTTISFNLYFAFEMSPADCRVKRQYGSSR